MKKTRRKGMSKTRRFYNRVCHFLKIDEELKTTWVELMNRRNQNFEFRKFDL